MLCYRFRSRNVHCCRTTLLLGAAPLAIKLWTCVPLRTPCSQRFAWKYCQRRTPPQKFIPTFKSNVQWQKVAGARAVPPLYSAGCGCNTCITIPHAFLTISRQAACRGNLHAQQRAGGLESSLASLSLALLLCLPPFVLWMRAGDTPLFFS